MAPKRRKKRVPQLKYTASRNIGWHVSFRDPRTNMPRRHRFGMANGTWRRFALGSLIDSVTTFGVARRGLIDMAIHQSWFGMLCSDTSPT